MYKHTHIKVYTGTDANKGEVGVMKLYLLTKAIHKINIHALFPPPKWLSLCFMRENGEMGSYTHTHMCVLYTRNSHITQTFYMKRKYLRNEVSLIEIPIVHIMRINRKKIREATSRLFLFEKCQYLLI